MTALVLVALFAPPPVGPVPADPFDRADDITVVAVVHPFTAAAWTAAGELLTVSPEKDEPGAAGLLRRYAADLTLSATVKLPATARELVLDEAAGRLFAVTGTPTDDTPSAGLLVVYKFADLTGESATPVATLRSPLRVTGVARSADGKLLYAAVGTAVLTVDATTLRQTASVKGAAERVTATGRPLGRAELGGPVLGYVAGVALVGDPPRLLRIPADGPAADITPADGLSAASQLAAVGDRLVLIAATGSGIEVLTLTGDKAVPVAKRAGKPPHEFRGPVAVSADGGRAACGCGTVAGLPK